MRCVHCGHRVIASACRYLHEKGVRSAECYPPVVGLSRSSFCGFCDDTGRICPWCYRRLGALAHQIARREVNALIAR